MHRLFFILAAALSSVFFSPSSQAAALNVAVVELPPYAQQDENGMWRGPAVDLFRAAAEAAQINYRFVAAQNGPQQGELARFPVLADARVVDETSRSLPFHVDTLALIGGSKRPGFVEGLAGLFNLGFLLTVAAICLLLLIVGFVFWLVERSDNDELKSDGSKAKGIGHGFWWAAVTATTIGYGDLVPRTLGGRIVAMIWMLFAMAITALLTAYLVSLTGGQDATTSLDEALSGQRVGYVTDGLVQPNNLRSAESTMAFANLPSALKALDADAIDAVAYPHQPAKAAAGGRNVQSTSGSVVLPVIQVSGSSSLRSALDQIILSPAWQKRMNDEYGEGK